MRSRIPGVVVAVAALVADQASKAWMLSLLSGKSIVVLPVLDLQLAWNTGISYSLFRADGRLGRILLVVVALAAVVALSIWLFRARRVLTSAALGLLIGGALGNAVDRALHGAVTDFLHLHWGDFSPFGVFNVADVAITAGVTLLLFEALFLKDGQSPRVRDEGARRAGVDSANNLP